MKKDFDYSDVRKIAKLARLRLSETEVTKMTKELNSFFGWFNELPQKAEDKDSVLGRQKSGKTLQLREDVIYQDTKKEDLLASAVASKDGFLVVPPVLKGENK